MGKTIALIGNPNCGKTTLFNVLTGSSQYVGNWPGVTVEKKSGKLLHTNQAIEIVDLPGIYSLSTYSLEEVISREFIESDETDLIINIIDASNLERNLFLTLQLMEIGKPMILVLNMMDMVKQRGDVLDVDKLKKILGVPMVEVIASKELGIDTLIQNLEKNTPKPQSIKYYRPHIQVLIDQLQESLEIPNLGILHAIRFIEEGPSAVLGHNLDPIKVASLNERIEHVLKDEGMDRDMVISDEKYRFISHVAQKVLTRNPQGKHTITDKIDAILTHRILALPLFFGIMWIVFMTAFGPLGQWLKGGFELLIDLLLIQAPSQLLLALDVSPWLYDLVINGILGGVTSVIGFLPEISILFLMLSILEDTGYMARAAFIMDRVLRKFGLSGKAFIPMILGFGCTVPALMATRTLENERDRRLTMMITPFMSCSARFPIYAVFAGAFFTQNQALVVYSMYVLGIIVAFVSGLFLKNIVTKNRVSSFILELPEYHWPTPKNLMLHTWERIKGFLIKAGTILVIASLIIYVMNTYTFSLRLASDSASSMIGSVGQFIAPIFKPLGFGDWRASIALLVGFIAKEGVVSTLGVLYNVGGDAVNNVGLLAEPLKTVFTPLSAYAFMVFTLLYLPCVAALATMKREMNSWKWTLIAVSYQTLVAWLMAFIVYQGGLLLGIGG